MSFLDNLENSLNSLENVSERTDNTQERNRQKMDRERALAVAPWAERLKTGEWTSQLMKTATREGFARRTKVYITWLGDMLRLEAREKRLELKPCPDGIEAAMSEEKERKSVTRIDLSGNPDDLIRDWLG